MKARYIKPTIEFEEYELNASIATGCQEIVSLGPGDEILGFITCSEYDQPLPPAPQSMFRSKEPEEVNFYENSCSCYLSAGIGSLFTS